MFCKRCSTRFDNAKGTCPHCGHATGGVTVDPLASSGVQGITSPAKAAPPAKADPSPEVEEEEVDLEDLAATPKPKSKPVPKSKPAAQPRPSTASKTPVFDLEPDEVRALLAEHPELVEKGLSVFKDKKGKPVGAGYAAADVGEIDVLTKDADGAFVVVMVPDRGTGDEIVGEVLQRMGWVRKHIAKDRKEVRGIVVLAETPESLTYTAAAVAGTVAFKSYRVSLTFSDVEI
jgi:hypothetical protein